MKVQVTLKSIISFCMIQASHSGDFDRDYDEIMDLVNKPGCADYYYPDDHNQQIKARGGDPKFRHMVQLLNQACGSWIPADMIRLSKVLPEVLNDDFMNRLLQKITYNMPCLVVDRIFEKYIRPLNPIYHHAALELSHCLPSCSENEFINLREGLYNIPPHRFEEADFLESIKAKIKFAKENANPSMSWHETLSIVEQEDTKRTFKFIVEMIGSIASVEWKGK